MVNYDYESDYPQLAPQEFSHPHLPPLCVVCVRVRVCVCMHVCVRVCASVCVIHTQTRKRAVQESNSSSGDLNHCAKATVLRNQRTDSDHCPTGPNCLTKPLQIGNTSVQAGPRSHGNNTTQRNSRLINEVRPNEITTKTEHHCYLHTCVCGTQLHRGTERQVLTQTNTHTSRRTARRFVQLQAK